MRVGLAAAWTRVRAIVARSPLPSRTQLPTVWPRVRAEVERNSWHVYAAIGGILAAAVAAGLVVAFTGSGTAPASVPSVVRISNGQSKAALETTGVYSDGWLQQNSTLVVAGGRAGNLVLHLQVPLQPTQHLSISVDGHPLASRVVKPGPLQLRLPVPASPDPRTVALHWDRAVPLTPPDTRKAAAQLTFLAVALPPTILRIPGDLSAPGASTSGIYPDGWSRKVAHVRLAAGPAAKLVVRATIPKGVKQRLTVQIDGSKLATETLSAGNATLKMSVPASQTTRDVTLQWSRVVELQAPDKRRAAAQLQYVGLAVRPREVDVPGGLSNPGLTYSGVYADGWLRRQAVLVLTGGSAGRLVIDANVPQQRTQTLTVAVNGSQIASQAVKPGKLHLSLPVPASRSPRAIKLSWKHTITLGPTDRRRASAQLTRIAVAVPPAVVTAPKGLTDPGLSMQGVYPDGWLKQDSTFVLAGGKAGNLVIRAEVPKQAAQTLTVVVNGTHVGTTPAAPGKLDVRLPVAASSTARKVELHWARTIALAPPDTRHAAAQLTEIGVVSPPASVSVPTGLADPGLTSSGIYADGWLQRHASLVLASGKAGTLAIDMTVLATPGTQTLSVVVNGVTAATRTVKPGELHLRLPIAASSSTRKIALDWSSVVKLAPPDTRSAAAQLQSIAIR